MEEGVGRHSPPPSPKGRGSQGKRAAPAPAWLGVPASWIYARAIAARNRRFDRGLGVIELDRPVLSVGNLSTGGTGKTPTVLRVVRWLTDAGRRPCIAMRGYAARGGAAGGASDEALEYARARPDIPVVARADRTAGLIDLFATDAGERVDAIVLDDGFQHRRLARALDLVLVDATADPFEDRLLPAGWLREPVGSLRRAHAIVITHAEGASASAIANLGERIDRAAGRAPIAACRHAWRGFRVYEGGRERVEPAAFLRGRRALAVCAIGNPAPFLSACANAAGRPLADRISLPDHDPYSRATIRRVLNAATGSRAEIIVTTAKDWSKLAQVNPLEWPAPIVVPTLDMVFDWGEDDLRRIVLAATESSADGRKP